MSCPEDDMTATDVFRFDMEAARLTYLLNKRKRGEPATLPPDVPSDRRVTANQDLPQFMKRQAD